MIERFSDWGGFLVNHLWEATLFAVLVVLLTIGLRRSPARIRHRLLLVASLKFLLPTAVVVSCGRALGLPMPNVASLSWWRADGLASPLAGAENLFGTVGFALLLVWAAGAVWLASRQWRLRRSLVALARSGRPLADDHPLAPVITRARRHAGVDRAITCRWVDDLPSPAVWGVRRPVLLLPVGLGQHLSADELDAVLVHELEHVRRRDNLIASLQSFLRAVFWFHPLVWWLDRRLLAERERACDERVVAVLGEPKLYARGLLKVVRFGLESTLPGNLSPRAIPGAAATASDLERRIEHIVTPSGPQRSAAWSHRFAAVVVALLFTLSLIASGQGHCDVASRLTVELTERYTGTGASVQSGDVLQHFPAKPPKVCQERKKRIERW
ncbi:MAG: M56 family metallopeptidase [Acidobacteriota bacterium]